MKIRNRLLVYALATSIGIGVASCTSEKEKDIKKENVQMLEEDVLKIKEKRMEYGR